MLEKIKPRAKPAARARKHSGARTLGLMQIATRRHDALEHGIIECVHLVCTVEQHVCDMVFDGYADTVVKSHRKGPASKRVSRRAGVDPHAGEIAADVTRGLAQPLFCSFSTIAMRT